MSYNNSVTNFENMSELELKRLNFPRWGHTIFGTILTIVVIFGFIENTMVLLVFYKSKKLRSATNIFVMGLCIADLNMLLIGCPFSVISAFNGRWAFSEGICTLAGFIVYFLGLTQLYLLTAISIDRYIVITKPLKSPLITKRVAVIACMSCFFGGLAWSVCPLIGWSQYGQEAPGVFCGLDIDNTHVSFVIVIFFSCFFLPFGIMAFCYFGIYSTIRNVNKNNVWDMKSRVARKNLKLEKKMLRSCIIMCGAFWACWFPYALVFFWQAVFGVETIPIVLSEIPALAAKSQGVLNPIIYGATNKMFREAFYECVPCTGLRSRLTIEDEGNQGTSTESDSDVDESDSVKNKRQCNRNSVVPTGRTVHVHGKGIDLPEN